jgi:tRNA 2-thiouridine synthesizing protein E
MTDTRIPIPFFDADGFIEETGAWTEDMARRIAALDGLGELDERQLSLLRQLRASYQRLGAPPALTHVCRLGGFAQDCMDTLFPNPREAWRIAGLPNPGEEAKSYL